MKNKTIIEREKKMTEYKHNKEDLRHLKNLNVEIATKVTLVTHNKDIERKDVVTTKVEPIKLFDEYQIKWFNQQSEENLIEYFEEVISHYRLQEEFLYSASNLIHKENELSNGLNYPIYQTDNYDEFNEWFEYGYLNKYPEAVYTELERVIKLYSVKDSPIEANDIFKERVND